MNNSKQSIKILMMVVLASVIVAGTGLAHSPSFADKDKNTIREMDDDQGESMEGILIEELGAGNNYEINTDAELCETEQCLIDAGI